MKQTLNTHEKYEKPSHDDTPAVYCYIDQWGARKAVLADWEHATAEQKQEAAVKAARKYRRERLKSAIAAVYNAGELDDNSDLLWAALP